jgi:hypothetical protein
MFYDFNEKLAKECKDLNIDVVFAAETSADILGLTSSFCLARYIGDQKLESDQTRWLKDSLHERDVVWEMYGVKVLDFTSTFCSLAEFAETDFGFTALRNYLSVANQKLWRTELNKRGLKNSLNEKLEIAHGLGIIDNVQLRDWSAEFEHQYYDVSKYR